MRAKGQKSRIFAEIVEETAAKSTKKKREQVFPRYHQLDVVRKLLAHAAQHGAGQRYLIQHSAGSGKSKSIAWLAHQLVGLRKDGADVFDSVIVITDRRILDQQITETIWQFTQVHAILGHSDDSGELRRFIESGKKIITTTVQKFPFILDEIGTTHRGRHFAIIIDEAHSSQGGRASASMSMALTFNASDFDAAQFEHDFGVPITINLPQLAAVSRLFDLQEARDQTKPSLVEQAQAVHSITRLV